MLDIKPQVRLTPCSFDIQAPKIILQRAMTNGNRFLSVGWQIEMKLISLSGLKPDFCAYLYKPICN